MVQLVAKLVGYDDNGNGIYYKEFAGDSNETKPKENLAVGSKFWEVDSGLISGFSAAEDDWVPQFSTKEG